MKRTASTTYGVRPLRLTMQMIASVIPPRTKGVYVLFAADVDGRLECQYVGRSDTDLRRRLLRHPHRHASSHFLFEPCDTASEAYRSEVRAYRRFRPRLNLIQPAVHAAARIEDSPVEWPVFRVTAA
jgi:hypothetical protein